MNFIGPSPLLIRCTVFILILAPISLILPAILEWLKVVDGFGQFMIMIALLVVSWLWVAGAGVT